MTIPAPPTLESLCQAGWISALDAHLAATLRRLGAAGEVHAAGSAGNAHGARAAHEAPAEEQQLGAQWVTVAVALTSAALAKGHVCLDLARAPVLGEEQERATLPWPEPAAWERWLRNSPLVEPHTEVCPDGPGERRPLVWERGEAIGVQRLYLRRYWLYQQGLVEALRARAQGGGPVDLQRGNQLLRQLFGPPRGEPGAERDPGAGQPGPGAAAGAATGTVTGTTAATEADAATGTATGTTAATATEAGAATGTATGTAPGSAPHTEPWDGQRVAAAVALTRRLAVISGGPGTGKTFTVVKIFAALVEEALRAGRPAPRVMMMAPTGKAAARLVESVQRALGNVACSEEARAAIPTQAFTIHRALGASRHQGRVRFRHHAEAPLPADVVLVDEASMVDMALMWRLVSALEPRARLILLGDRDQLASVEAGSVLGDICNTGGGAHFSAPFAQTLRSLTGEAVEGEGPPGMGDCVVQLRRSYRYGAGSGIGRLAEAIKAGEGRAVLELLSHPALPDVSWVRLEEDGEGERALYAHAVRGYGPYLRAESPQAQLEAFGAFRLLAAHRRGPLSVDTLGRGVEAALARAGLITPRREHYGGRPVAVTANDYSLNLFNGDIGLVVEGAAGARAYFPGLGAEAANAKEGEARAGAARAGQDMAGGISVARLPPHETAYVLTVHKSQGSEFNEVAVVLPPVASPVITRELLYTAVTRCRRKVTVYAPQDVLLQAVARPVHRASGLRDQLWAV